MGVHTGPLLLLVQANIAPEHESLAILLDLTEHAMQREFTYSHQWQAGDLVVWNNQQTMHRSRPYPHTDTRDMRRTTLAGSGLTVEAQAALWMCCNKYKSTCR